MKLIDYLVFDNSREIVVIATKDENGNPTDSFGIKLNQSIENDGYVRLTSSELTIANAAKDAINEIDDLAFPDEILDVKNAVYHSEVWNTDNTISTGNNVACEFVQPSQDGSAYIDTGNLRHYVIGSAPKQSIKNRIDAFGFLVTQIINR